MAKREAITAEYVRAILHYNPETGVFTWRERAGMRPQWNARYAGKSSGNLSKKDKCWRIDIDDVAYLAHRLAWLYVTGEWPKDKIDHRDTNASNNRFKNLREATQAENACNTRRRSDNTSGLKSVGWHKQCSKWRARITKDGKEFHLGLFNNIEEAAAAYANAASEIHGEFARIE